MRVMARPEPFLGVLKVACSACGRGFHKECRRGCKKCHPKVKLNITDITSSGSQSNDGPKQRKSTNLIDPKSTGRKRAARLYKIDPNQPCEWRGLKNCGGGLRPVVGCVEGKQQHRHHGPIKNPTRNYEGNVHRICTACHVHWHELNDLVYNEKDYGLLPHEPDEASPEELVQNLVDWQTGAMGRRFKLASSENHNKKPKIDD